MKKIALIGESIAHSLSPKLFEAAYNLREEFSYSLLDYPTLKEAMEIFFNEGYIGANITSPYKEEILSYCTELDITTQQTGAANLILKQENGIKAYNTDCDGLYGPIKNREIKPCKVIVIGAGGAAKAAVFILKEKGFIVTVVNRTLDKAKTLANDCNVEWCAMDKLPELLQSNNLLIYTIGVDTPILKKTLLNHVNILKNLTIVEANYKSPSLNSISCKEYISGTEWLVYQAVPSFKLFTGKDPDIFAMFKLTNNC